MQDIGGWDERKSVTFDRGDLSGQKTEQVEDIWEWPLFFKDQYSSKKI